MGFAVVTFVVPQIFVRGNLASQSGDALQELDEDTQFVHLFPLFQTAHIIRCALLEGAAFFNLVAFMSTGSVWNLVMAFTLLVLIGMRFPTLYSSQVWVQDRVRELQDGVI